MLPNNKNVVEYCLIEAPLKLIRLFIWRNFYWSKVMLFMTPMLHN